MSNVVHVSDQRRRGITIDFEFDDLGLDPYAFRVYARLVRRAGTPKGAYESVAEMARGCRMSPRRVHDALRELEARHLVAKVEKPGRPSVYQLLDKSQWRTSAPAADPPTPAPRAEGSAPDAEGSARGADEVVQGNSSKEGTTTDDEERARVDLGFGEAEPLLQLQQTDREAHKVLSMKGRELGWQFRHKNLAAARILSDRESGLAALLTTHKAADSRGAKAYLYFERILDDPQPKHRQRSPAARQVERDYSQDVSGADLLDQATSVNGRWN